MMTFHDPVPDSDDVRSDNPLPLAPSIDGDQNQGLRTSRYVVTPCGRVHVTVINVLLSVLVIVFNLMINISLTNYAHTLKVAGSDPFNLLLFAYFWKIVIFVLAVVVVKLTCQRSLGWRPTISWRVLTIVGLLACWGSLLTGYGSPPSRTPPRYQVLMGNLSIPFTVAARYLILRIGIGFRRTICTSVIIAGLVVVLVPQMVTIDTVHVTNSTNSRENSTHTEEPPAFGRLVWPLLYGLGFLPGSIASVLLEKALKAKGTETLSLSMWLRIFDYGWIMLFFWTNFIPGFGMTDSPEAFLKHLQRNLQCHFGQDPACRHVMLTAAIYILSHCASAFAGIVLLKYSDSAIYLTLVGTVGSPIGTIFWALFQPRPYLHWAPTYNNATTCTIVGLITMLPGILAYNYFNHKEATQASRTPRSDQYELLAQTDGH